MHIFSFPLLFLFLSFYFIKQQLIINSFFWIFFSILLDSNLPFALTNKRLVNYNSFAPHKLSTNIGLLSVEMELMYRAELYNEDRVTSTSIRSSFISLSTNSIAGFVKLVFMWTLTRNSRISQTLS